MSLLFVNVGNSFYNVPIAGLIYLCDMKLNIGGTETLWSFTPVASELFIAFIHLDIIFLQLLPFMPLIALKRA